MQRRKKLAGRWACGRHSLHPAKAPMIIRTPEKPRPSGLYEEFIGSDAVTMNLTRIQGRSSYCLRIFRTAFETSATNPVKCSPRLRPAVLNRCFLRSEKAGRTRL